MAMENEIGRPLTEKKKRSEKKKKVNLVFDPQARREYLTGFRKRKNERRKRAQEQLDRLLKEEKKTIKRKTKEAYRAIVTPYKRVPQSEHLMKEEHDWGSHSVEITELSTNELAKENNWIGSNQVKYEEPEDYNIGNDSEDSKLVPGMELEEKPVNKPKGVEKKPVKVKSIKELKRTVRMEATKHVQKSKAFKTHNIKEKMKNKKKSKREKREKERALKKSKKSKHGGLKASQSQANS